MSKRLSPYGPVTIWGTTGLSGPIYACASYSITTLSELGLVPASYLHHPLSEVPRVTPVTRPHLNGPISPPIAAFRPSNGHHASRG